jgi:AhpD family alkylhydroperoxidase
MSRPGKSSKEQGSIEMTKDWVALTSELSDALKGLRQGAPGVMQGFAAIARAALEKHALDTKTKELIALAVAVAVRCDPCIASHSEAAVKQGATREEVMEAIGVAILMGAGPSVMYGARAAQAFEQFLAPAQPPAA